ncbi:hypothetical protein Tco_1286278, partial [Tanacetum coccineum]
EAIKKENVENKNLCGIDKESKTHPDGTLYIERAKLVTTFWTIKKKHSATIICTSSSTPLWGETQTEFQDEILLTRGDRDNPHFSGAESIMNNAPVYHSVATYFGVLHSPTKSKVTGRGSLRSKWITRDMVMSTKRGDKVFNPKPVSEFNPTMGCVVKFAGNVKDKVTVVADKPDDVVKDKVDVIKDIAPVVKDKLVVVVVKQPAEVVKDKVSVKDKVHVDVVNDKAQVDVVSVGKDKSVVDVVSDKDNVFKVNASDVVKDKAPAVMKNKSVGNIFKEKVPTIVKGKKHAVVKDKAMSDIPKDKSKAGLPKDKPKPNPKRKVNPKVQALSEFLDLRSLNQKQDDSKKKLKLKQLKGKTKIEHSDSELATDEVDSSSDEVDRKPKKLKVKGWLKRKMNGSDFDSSFIEEKDMVL